MEKQFKIIIALDEDSDDIIVELEKRYEDCIQTFKFRIDECKGDIFDAMLLTMRSGITSRITDLAESLLESALITNEMKTEKLKR